MPNALQLAAVMALLSALLSPAALAHGKDYSNHYGTDFRCTGYRYV